MNIATIKAAGKHAAQRGLLLGKKYAPEILLTVGVGGVLTAGVLGAKQTLKLEPVIDRTNEKLDTLRALATAEDDNVERYSHDKTRIYINAGAEVVKIYSGPVLLATASVGCILASHGIMRRRNAGLLAIVGVLETSIANYRERVVEKYGEEEDAEFASGYRLVERKNEESGETEVVRVLDPKAPKPYARIFGRNTSRIWDPTPEYNVITINAQQVFANQKLQAVGHVFLNEIYDSLGLEHSREGALVGWVKGQGDDYIDFGAGDMDNIRTGAYLDGTEGHIYLDFNVDGVIWDKI